MGNHNKRTLRTAILTVPIIRVFVHADSFFKELKMNQKNPATVIIGFFLCVIFMNPQTCFSIGENIYWSGGENHTKIQKLSAEQTPVDIIAGLEAPSCLAYHQQSNKIYWGEFWKGTIKRSSLDGSNIETIILNGSQTVWDIEIDPINNMLYWSDPHGHSIYRSDLNGQGVEELPMGNLESPVGISLDISNKKIYWADDVESQIFRANLDGSNIETLVNSGVYPYLQDVELDLINGKIYWTEAVSQKIKRADLNGTNIENVVSYGLGDLYGLDLDLINNAMYWADYSNGRILKSDLNGNDMEIIVQGVDYTWGVINVPEPATLSLLALGGLCFLRRVHK